MVGPCCFWQTCRSSAKNQALSVGSRLTMISELMGNQVLKETLLCQETDIRSHIIGITLEHPYVLHIFLPQRFVSMKRPFQLLGICEMK